MFSRKFILLGIFLLQVFLGSGALFAQSGNQNGEQPKRPQLNEKTLEVLGSKWKQAFEKKSYKEAHEALDALLPTLKKGSFDFVIVSQHKAQTFIAEDRLEEATPHLAVAANSRFFPEETRSIMLNALAYFYFQQSRNDKGNLKPNEVAELLRKSQQTMETMLSLSVEAKPQAYQFLATVQYFRADSLPVESKERERLFAASAQTLRGALIRSPSAPVDYYQFQASLALQLKNTDLTAACLEVIVDKKPEDKTYWRSLAQLYAQDDATLYRSISVFKRAKAYGHLQDPADIAMLLNVYARAKEFLAAADLLSASLQSGKVDPKDEKNWQQLSYFYQEMNRYEDAIASLQEGTKVANTGAVAFSLAQFLAYNGRQEEAVVFAEQAWRKGGNKRPLDVLGFLLHNYRTLTQREKTEEYLTILKQEVLKPDHATTPEAQRALVLIAYTHYQRQDLEVSREFAARALSIAPASDSGKSAENLVKNIDTILENKRRQAERDARKAAGKTKRT